MLHPHVTERPTLAGHNGVRHRSGHRPGPNGGLRQTDTFQPVLTIRGTVNAEEAARFTREALREIHDHITERHLEVEGPPFSVSRPLPHHRLDIEAGWPVSRAGGGGRVHSGALPIARLRTSR